MGVKVTRKNNISKLGSKIKSTNAVKVGFFTDAAYPDGTPIVDVAINNEFGVPHKNIPPRPFMKQTFNRYNKKWLPMINALISKEITSGKNDYTEALNKLGLVIQGEIRSTIANGQFAPNAPSTVAAKGKDTPLRDTLVMLNAVNYEVVKK